MSPTSRQVAEDQVTRVTCSMSEMYVFNDVESEPGLARSVLKPLGCCCAHVVDLAFNLGHDVNTFPRFFRLSLCLCEHVCVCMCIFVCELCLPQGACHLLVCVYVSNK